VAIYTERFTAGRQNLGTGATIWTVPSDGAVYVLRDLIVMHVDSVARHIGVYVHSGSFDAYVWDFPSLGGHTTQQWTGRQVLLGGDTLNIITDVTGTVSWLVTGYRLT